MSDLSKVRHDYIRYANVWEDAALLLKGLAARAGERHLSIASAGDNAFMLLTSDPEIVVAVDINAPQLHLCALKREAMRHLDREAYLAFAGFTPSATRLAAFETIAPSLSPAALQYWQQNTAILENGIVHAGKFERYFKLFAHWVLPFIHAKKTVEELLRTKSAAEQHDFYQKRWNTWRWRMLFKIFFSKFVMGKAGRDPAFLKEVNIPVGEFIFNQAERHLSSTAAQNNHILRFNLTGSFGQTLPDYVQPDHYEKIKAGLDRLQLHHGFAEAAIEQWGKFDCFNLSNIFEYMDDSTFKLVAAQLLAGAKPGARFAYWNLMVPRNMAEIMPGRLSNDPIINILPRDTDRGFFYNKFIVNILEDATTDH
jgi:S-adenosylmethionine-diacylglycerol 3-amino-3-carboxypropyl transferase